MKVQEFFKKWTATRPNLKTSFHDAGIEAMAFAEAYYEQQLNERKESTNKSEQHDSKALHIADVVRSLPSDDEIEKEADTKIFISSVKRKYSSVYSEGFEDGAKWIKDKITKS